MAVIVTLIFVIALVIAFATCLGCVIIPIVLLIRSLSRKKKDD